MDEADIRLYFDLSSLSRSLALAAPHCDQQEEPLTHVGCQHRLSSPAQPVTPGGFRFQFGSKKLFFLHGTKSEWVNTRVGVREVVEVVEEVEDPKYLESFTDSSDGEEEEGAEEENHWRTLQRVLRRLEKSRGGDRSRGEVGEAGLVVVEAGPDTEDILSRLLTEGCYDHIMERILSLLDWNSLHSLLSVEAVWQENVRLYWLTERFVRRLDSHWRLFVPSQRELRWNSEVSAMASDLRFLVCGFSGGGLVKYWRTNYSAEFSISAHSGVRVVKVGFNTTHLVTAGADRQLKVWRLEGGEALCSLSHPGGTVQDLKVGRENIITASANKSLYLHQVERASSGELRLRTLLRLRGHTRPVTCLDYDDHWVLSGALDKTVRLWSVSRAEQISVLTGHFLKVSDVKLSQPLAVSVSWDGTLRLWDLPASTCIRIIEHRLHLERVSLCGRWLVTADEDSTVFVFSLAEARSPELPLVIGVGSEARRQMGVRCLNTYSGDIVDIQVEDGALVTLINTGDTKETIQGRIVCQVSTVQSEAFKCELFFK